MKYDFLHKDFKLNGNSFSSQEELLSFTHIDHKDIHKFLNRWFNESLFIYVYTSGSTGKPKQIQLKKEYMVNSALATGKYFDLPSKTSSLLCLPLEHIAGKMMMVRAMILGWEIDVVKPSSRPLMNLSKEYEFSAMVPLQLFNSLDEISMIKTLIVGGGEVSQALRSKIMDLSVKIYATYGMTETITHIAVKPLNKASGLNYNDNLYNALPNVSFKADLRNCLIIDALKVSEKQIVTNDIVEVVTDNKFKWLGRFDHIINTGGIKLIPEQIEEKLYQIIRQRFFITSVPDEVLGEKVVLVVEGDVAKNLNSQILKLKSITKFEIPKEVYFIKQFLETETKKIQRQRTLDLILLQS